MRNRFRFMMLIVWAIVAGFQTVATAQTCPNQLLFSFGNIYYYNGIVCPSGDPIDEVYTFDGPVDTGCGSDACKTEVTPYTMLFAPRVVGNPPGEENVIRPLPPETSLMVPFGASRISMVNGYPKFVKGQINGADRFFKVYHVSYTDAANRRREVRIGMEVSGVPQGQAVVNATNSEVIGKRLQLTIDTGLGQRGTFEALFQLINQ